MFGAEKRAPFGAIISVEPDFSSLDPSNLRADREWLRQSADRLTRPVSLRTNLHASHFFPLNVPSLLFGLWVLAHGLAWLLSGEVTPQRPGRPLLALLWHFLLTGGLWSWTIRPSVGQAYVREYDLLPFPREEAGAGLRLSWGRRSILTSYLRPSSSSASHHQNPAALTSRWVDILLSPHMACCDHKTPSQEPRRGLDFRPGMALLLRLRSS